MFLVESILIVLQLLFIIKDLKHFLPPQFIDIKHLFIILISEHNDKEISLFD